VADPVVINETVEEVDPLTLTEHPENPRRSDDLLIEKLIRAHGFYGTITAQRSTGYVLAGNGRLRAARRLGMPYVPVTWVDVDDDTAREILAGDNRASDVGSYDDAALAALLTGLADTKGLDGTGYSDNDLGLLLQQLESGAGYGTLTEGMTPAERQAVFDAADLRTVVLPYPAEQYTRVVKQLADVRFRLDCDSFADAVALLIDQAHADIETDP
jgi:ParB-like nuclease domain